jgi:hypothetical protein
MYKLLKFLNNIVNVFFFSITSFHQVEQLIKMQKKTEGKGEKKLEMFTMKYKNLDFFIGKPPPTNQYNKNIL